MRFASVRSAGPLARKLVAWALVAGGLGPAAAVTSEWVRTDAAGKLIYKTTERGDRILDFSFAGYHGGGVSLPAVPARENISAVLDGDSSAAIQQAVDRVAALPLVNGFRGAVVLAPGIYHCERSIALRANGIVLRGTSGPDGRPATTIYMTGAKHVAFLVGEQARNAGDPAPAGSAAPRGARARPVVNEVSTTIVDAYIPAGTNVLHVADAKGFRVGDAIAIRRPVTREWVEFMQMHDLVRDGKKQTWLAVGSATTERRHVAGIRGNAMTIDVPVADSFDAKFLQPHGASVTRTPPPLRVHDVGIETLRIECPPLAVEYTAAPYSAIRLDADDCWVRDVDCVETMNATVLAGDRITMEQVRVSHTFPNLGASKPSDFSIEGSQILIDRCTVVGDNEYSVWTSSMHPGPNVVLNSTFRGRGSYIQPHHRWSTGLLVDNCTVPDGGIDYMNRGVGGSGHGWTMGWGVVWNCVGGRYIIQSPPGTMNWAIGNQGDRVRFPRFFDTAPVIAEGTFDAHGTRVDPASLYLAQLADRLGPSALAAIGYGSNTGTEFTNRTVPRLPALPVAVDPQLGPALAQNRPVDTSGNRGSRAQFGGEKALDGDPETYWATPDLTAPARFEVDTEGPVEINAIVVEEMPAMTGQVHKFKIEGQVNSDWVLLAEGDAIGARAIYHFPNVTVWKVRLTIITAAPFAAIRTFGIYRQPTI